ncbi:hypothetical protein ALO46_101989 [Pseudomonas syringae pv. solidagae]|uniref:Uncharacterized protein n=1 Tax=Pseudomonas syringae pv. solidagae TaxID=264458 RepID=A0A0N8ST42_PSESX|nr:hypothetical protein ALO46_101989 [Pseudomonas syringae pv. solidagae]RMR51553.1 hypothetical protein ALP85_101789 [Pseudomonas syringae pv. syringae]RMT31443.1 hypothetical protein ALP49_102012 [Pseudomonas syringae pv. solidagae]RMT38256.1 hypothetical protein ALP48_101963 [Pseudomonas syringae pv. solidagae]
MHEHPSCALHFAVSCTMGIGQKGDCMHCGDHEQALRMRIDADRTAGES